MKSKFNWHVTETINDGRYFDDLDNTFGITDCKKEYDPYEHANSVFTIGFAGASVHLIRIATGAGILVIPYAFSLVGYGAAIAAITFISVIYLNNIHSLLWTEYQLCKTLKIPNLTFIGVIDKSFDVSSKNVQAFRPYIKFLLYLVWALPSANGIHLIIISSSCRRMTQHFHKENDFQAIITVVMVIMMALCLIPRLKFLVPLSILINLFTLCNLIIISIITFDPGHWGKNVKLLGDVTKLPQFLAMFLNSIGITGMVIPLKNEMQNPKELNSRFGVLNISCTLLSLMVSSFGLVGYFNNGASINDNILLNLPQDSWVSLIVLILYTLSLCITYILMFYVYYETIWREFFSAKLTASRFENVCKYCVRVAINLMAYGMALTLPDFGLFVSIIGTLGILIDIGLPPTLLLLVSRMASIKPAAFWIITLKNSIIILLSVVLFVMSMEICILNIIQKFRKS